MNNDVFVFRRGSDNYYFLRHFHASLCLNEPEITAPAEYNGEPVAAIGCMAFGFAHDLERVTISEGIRLIGERAFCNCQKLRSVSLPASLEMIDKFAFSYCPELREVEFRSAPRLEEFVFEQDFKLPAELILAGQICSFDITQPIGIEGLRKEFASACKFYDYDYLPWFTHSGAFALAAQNDCFRGVDAGLLDDLTEYCTSKKMVEQTAYFLDLKKRKFGFKKDSDFDL